jgi:ribosomal RNA-processing protein 8
MSFEVPGFNLPSEPVAAASKKRKRPSKVAEDASAALPAVNVEKLLNKYESLLKAQSPASKPHAAAVGKSDTKLSKKQKKANNKQASEPAPVDTQEASSSKVSQEPTNEKRAQKKQKKQAQPDDGLSELQQKMKGKLGGARFRWINEQLASCSAV